MKQTFTIFFLCLCFAATAQDCWLKPGKYIYKRGETINITFQAGENFKGNNWKKNKDDIENLHLFFSNVSDKKLHTTLDNDDGDSLQISILDETTAIVAMNTKNSFSDMAGEKFNNYLRENGFTKALDDRVKNGDTMKAGRQYVEHSAKTIVQVGKNTNKEFKKKTGLAIDIIPDEHPYSFDKDGNFKLKILFLGKPLKNVKVKVLHKIKDKLGEVEYTTDDDGEIKIFLAVEGEWLITCSTMVKLENDDKAEWKTYRGSLTWGYY